MAETNPNKVNQYTDPDPRQAEFLKNYLDTESDTFSNAYQSAIKAQYSEDYASNIMNVLPKWLGENIGSQELIKKAEKNINKFLDENYTLDDKIKADITKFVLERLNKAKYSTKSEIEHSGSIEQEIKVDEATKSIISDYIQWRKKV